MPETDETPRPHSHGEYDREVPGVDKLEPDYDAEETDETLELVEDEDGPQ